MKSDDSDQNDTTLPKTTTTRLIAEAAARQVVIEHIGLCPFAGSQVEARLRKIETSFARLTGFMVGSGLLGGVAGAVVSKLLK